MARVSFPKLDVLKTHRGWEDWVSAVLGGLLLLTPALVQGEMPPPVLFSALLVGVVIMAMALFEIMLKGRWEEIIQLSLVCGWPYRSLYWITASPVSCVPCISRLARWWPLWRLSSSGRTR